MDNQNYDANEMKHLQNQLNDLNTKFDKIMNVLVGDDLLNEGGFVKRVQEMEERLDDIEKLWDKVKFFVMGAVVFGGYGLFEFFKNVITKIK